VAKDDRLLQYSALSGKLLVDALEYIKNFRHPLRDQVGRRHGEESLKKSFWTTSRLLRAVGCVPSSCTGRPGDTRSWRSSAQASSSTAAGHQCLRPEGGDGVTGSINTELVTLRKRQRHRPGLRRLGKGRRPDPGAEAGAGSPDLGQVGEVTRVNRDFLEMLLQQGYVRCLARGRARTAELQHQPRQRGRRRWPSPSAPRAHLPLDVPGILRARADRPATAPI